LFGPENPIAYDKALCRQHHKVENTFAKPEDCRWIATRYDRCAHTFSAICISATVAFYVN
jgi:transposase